MNKKNYLDELHQKNQSVKVRGYTIGNSFDVSDTHRKNYVVFQGY